MFACEFMVFLYRISVCAFYVKWLMIQLFSTLRVNSLHFYASGSRQHRGGVITAGRNGLLSTANGQYLTSCLGLSRLLRGDNTKMKQAENFSFKKVCTELFKGGVKVSCCEVNLDFLFFQLRKMKFPRVSRQMFAFGNRG